MRGRPWLKASVNAAGLSFAVVMLLVITSCNSSSFSPPASSNQASSTGVPIPKKAPTTGSSQNGKALFQETCATCHGMEGQGVPHLGADLQTSKFVANSTNSQLVAFIKQGRAANDPLNTMHLAMPPKGGNPALNIQDLYDIVAFIRQIQKTHAQGR